MKVICMRCRRAQDNRVADLIDKTKFFIGCKHCGYPYAIYAKEAA